MTTPPAACGPAETGMPPAVWEKLKAVRLLLLDVDGVLTDGKIVYTEAGEEIKAFSVKDGLGIRLLMDAGVQVGIVTARMSGALRHRCRNLGIDMVMDGIRDKRAALDLIMEKTGISDRRIAFVGDDLLDLPLMLRVGLSVAVSDASEVLIGAADLVTRRGGGDGAVREVCEALLKAQGKWAAVLARYGVEKKTVTET